MCLISKPKTMLTIYKSVGVDNQIPLGQMYLYHEFRVTYKETFMQIVFNMVFANDRQF